MHLALARGWTVAERSARDLLVLTGWSHRAACCSARSGRWRRWFGAGSGLAPAAALLGLVRRHRRGRAAGIAWLTTYKLAQAAFGLVIPVQSLSFTRPAADTLMLVLSPPGQALKFGLGQVPGVALGAFISAALRRELKWEGFEGGQSMRRYIASAVLMGFGGMPAGGCAVGAGVSGAAVFTLTSWVTRCAIWASATVTDRLVDRPNEAKMLPLTLPTDRLDPQASASYARP